MIKPQLRVDQVADLSVYIRDEKVLNLSEPGTGKTPSVCVLHQYRWEHLQKRTIWIMPKSLLEKNKDEIIRFTDFTSEDIEIIDGTPKKVERLLAREPRVLLMGPDRFKGCFNKRLLNSKMYNAVDVDEFHLCFGGPTSARTVAFNNYAQRCDQMVLMTGTMINGRLDTCFSAIHAVQPRYYPFGYQQFLAQHAILDDYGRPISWHSHGKISKIFERHGIRRLFKDIHGDQKVVTHIRKLNMHPTQRKYYDELAELASVEIEDAMIHGTTPGVNAIRGRQIMDHPETMPTDQGIKNLLPKGALAPKYDELLIDVADHKNSGEPFIVFASLVAQQKKAFELIQEAGIKVGWINSNLSGKKRSEVSEAFRRGDIQCIVSSPPLSGVGYNWQFSGKRQINHVIFMSLPYLDGDYVQAYRRAIRQNRDAPLRISIYEFKKSIDLRIKAILARKSREANKVDETREILDFKVSA